MISRAKDKRIVLKLGRDIPNLGSEALRPQIINSLARTLRHE